MGRWPALFKLFYRPCVHAVCVHVCVSLNFPLHLFLSSCLSPTYGQGSFYKLKAPWHNSTVSLGSGVSSFFSLLLLCFGQLKEQQMAEPFVGGTPWLSLLPLPLHPNTLPAHVCTHSLSGTGRGSSTGTGVASKETWAGRRTTDPLVPVGQCTQLASSPQSPPPAAFAPQPIRAQPTLTGPGAHGPDALCLGEVLSTLILASFPP